MSCSSCVWLHRLPNECAFACRHHLSFSMCFASAQPPRVSTVHLVICLMLSTILVRILKYQTGAFIDLSLCRLEFSISAKLQKGSLKWPDLHTVVCFCFTHGSRRSRMDVFFPSSFSPFFLSLSLFLCVFYTHTWIHLTTDRACQYRYSDGHPVKVFFIASLLPSGFRHSLLADLIGGVRLDSGGEFPCVSLCMCLSTSITS